MVNGLRSRPTLLLLSALLAHLAAGAAGADEATHDRAFWRGVAEADFAVPEGESAIGLLAELSTMLGSTDAELRDEFGYGITARWVYRDRLFTAEELRPFVSEWSANFERGIGETGTDSVLRRSFSALNLSVLAALDNVEPFMTEEEYADLLDSALRYFGAERDLRGHVEGLGWVHPLAHTADLLKFLARSPHLQPAQQVDVLAAIASRTALPDDSVYAWGEGERFARVALSVVLRPDFDAEAFGLWLQRLAGAATGLWEGAFDARQYAEVQNAKAILLNLHLMLGAVENPTEVVEQARQAVAEAAGSM